MDDIINQGGKLIERVQTKDVHTREVVLYTLSKAIERAAYYGMRGLIVLYMISESIGMSHKEALMIYGWFTTALLFSMVMGGFLGDLLIGNKNSIILGGILQGVGAFALCIPSSVGIYIGIGLITLGGGLYSPNLNAQFGKLYLNKTKLLDAGFTILYTSVNVGSFIGVLVMGYLGGINFALGFIVSGILMFVSIVFPFFIREKEISNQETNENNIGRNVMYVIIAAVLIGIFWGVYEVGITGVYELQVGSSKYTPFLHSINSCFAITFGIIGCIIWSFFYINRILKIGIGFIIASISFAILLLLTENNTDNYVILLIFSGIILSFAEMLIAPVFNSIVTKKTNPKYLAIVFSLVFIPATIFRYLAGIFISFYYDKPFVNLGFSSVMYGLIGVGLIVTLIITTRIKLTRSYKNSV
ncbi:MAG: hypothetical protein COB15_06645 [Flavobacteriales bacterium]|nr:MAG: hypothetical protein COB15_06645 [Flavobacteriales bacterium]